jgi:hypothetical protein
MVHNPFLGLNISEYRERSFFGDYQIMLNIKPMYDYIATSSNGSNTWCMSINGEKFLKLCNSFPDFRSFMLVRGMQRRAFLKKTEQELIDKLYLKDQYKRYKSALEHHYDLLMREKPLFVTMDYYMKTVEYRIRK